LCDMRRRSAFSVDVYEAIGLEGRHVERLHLPDDGFVHTWLYSSPADYRTRALFGHARYGTSVDQVGRGRLR
jgi:hypothetical protein